MSSLVTRSAFSTPDCGISSEIVVEEEKEKERRLSRTSSLARDLFRAHDLYRMRTASESSKRRLTGRALFRAIPYRFWRNSSHARSENRWTARSNHHSGAQPTEDAETGGPRRRCESTACRRQRGPPTGPDEEWGGALQRGLTRSGEGPSRSNGALDAARRRYACSARAPAVSTGRATAAHELPLLFAVIIVIMRILHRGVLVG